MAGVILSSPALGICLRLFKRTRKYLELASLLTPNLPLELVKWNEALRRVKRLNSILPDWTAELLRDPLCTVRFTPQWFTELLHNGAKALSVDAKLIEQFMETISSVDIARLVFSEGTHQRLLHEQKDETLEHVSQWLCNRL